MGTPNVRRSFYTLHRKIYIETYVLVGIYIYPYICTHTPEFRSFRFNIRKRRKKKLYFCVWHRGKEGQKSLVSSRSAALWGRFRWQRLCYTYRDRLGRFTVVCVCVLIIEFVHNKSSPESVFFFSNLFCICWFLYAVAIFLTCWY